MRGAYRAGMSGRAEPARGNTGVAAGGMSALVPLILTPQV